MTLHELNTLSRQQLQETLFRCCGSSVWVERMLPFFPADDLVELLEDAEEQWFKCSKNDWLEAFSHHPKIGDINTLAEKFASTVKWASSEQAGVNTASVSTLEALTKANAQYEQKFGYIFIICASGKTAEEMLALLLDRLANDPSKEINIAADEQNKITQLRLQKLLDE